MNALAQELPRAAINAKLVSLIATGSIALGVFLSGFVIREPAPYELYMVVLLPVWALFGLKFSRGIMPLVTLIVLFNIGGFLSMTVMAEIRDTPLYLAVSLFLGFTAIFFAAVTEQKPHLLKPMFDAWIVAAVFTSFFGILGYFHAFPGAEMFTKYERAAGVFQDPNVFGPFLVPPALVLLHRLVTGRVSGLPRRALPRRIITLGALRWRSPCFLSPFSWCCRSRVSLNSFRRARNWCSHTTRRASDALPATPSASCWHWRSRSASARSISA